MPPLSMPRYRLAGVSGGNAIASFGVQWQIDPSDKDIATDLPDELENRRILWEQTDRELADRCAASAGYMREFLGTMMRTPGIGKGLKRELKVMQGHFRQFMSDLTTYGLDQRGPVDPQSLERVLAWLRATVGEQVGLLAAQYGVTVSDDLASIVPDRNGWFFERF